MTTGNALLQAARAIQSDMTELFITLHQYPELGNRENSTAALIRAELDKIGLEWAPAAGTGTVAILRGGRPGPTIGIRADIDALPLTEETNLPYASRTAGVMHACGHDFHTASLLGAARLLAARREALAGSVKFFFQPDEEGDGGAARMIAEGCMAGPAVDAVLCAHVESGIPTGTVRVRPGPICAASNPFTITLRGKGSHGAKPHLGTDVIVAGSQIVTALQTIASRKTSPTEPVVLSVGTFHSGTAGNILAEEAKLSGIMRTMGGEARERVKTQFCSLVSAMARAMDVEAEIGVFEGYPGCWNDGAMTDLLRRAAGKVLGEENVLVLAEPSMGTDDFGYFSAMVPGCYYYVGVGNEEKGFTSPNHNPRFAVDPEALPFAAAIHVQTVLDYLDKTC